jgi:hypothetical protein
MQVTAARSDSAYLAGAMLGWLALSALGCSLVDGAQSGCKSYDWPRVVIEFGDPGGWNYRYAWRADDGLTGFAGACNALTSTPAFQCNLAIGGDAAEENIAVFVVPDDAQTDVIGTVDVPLMSYNTTGTGIALLVVTTTDGGLPVVTGPQYVNACP